MENNLNNLEYHMDNHQKLDHRQANPVQIINFWITQVSFQQGKATNAKKKYKFQIFSTWPEPQKSKSREQLNILGNYMSNNNH